MVERGFEHVPDGGGMRRVWLRGCENISKRYLIHTAAFKLGLILRKLTGFGTSRGLAEALRALLVCRVAAFGRLLRRITRWRFGDQHRTLSAHLLLAA